MYEDIIVKSICSMIHKCPDLEDIPIYDEKVNQTFKVPSFFVYNAYTKVTNPALRNREVYQESARYSIFIEYKNGVDQTNYEDAYEKGRILRRLFRYVKIITPNKKELIFHVDDFDITVNESMMLLVIRFRIPYKYIKCLKTVRKLEDIIIVKEEN